MGRSRRNVPKVSRLTPASSPKGAAEGHWPTQSGVITPQRGLKAFNLSTAHAISSRYVGARCHHLGAVAGAVMRAYPPRGLPAAQRFSFLLQATR